ncbi:helix-turn-helix domain-containing protein [Longibacter sp.]|jgi:AraC family transcriptional regulator|uniref:helix-turn-helix domain-containing protein n=1 Tax=Longibacter sp. TaxID=2045415 RepID=UPI003EBCE9AD
MPFREAETGVPVEALADAEMEMSAEVVPGALVEVGSNPEWETRDLVVPRHYLALNLDPEPLELERRGAGGIVRETLMPKSFWVNPPGRPFSHRVARKNRFGLIALKPDLVTRLTGREEMETMLAYGVADPQLYHLTRALIGEVRAGFPGGLVFMQSVVTALAAHLVRNHGVEPPTRPSVQGGLTQQQTNRVIDFIEARLVDDITVEDIAAEAALSAGHFSRLFKAKMGETPYRYVMRRRVERARTLLDHGDRRVGEVARRIGFSGTSHLTRQFKHHFGITPSQFQQEARR